MMSELDDGSRTLPDPKTQKSKYSRFYPDTNRKWLHCVFSYASANLRDRSEILSHVPSENATSLGIIHLVIVTRALPGSNRKPLPSRIIRLIYLSTLG